MQPSSGVRYLDDAILWGKEEGGELKKGQRTCRRLSPSTSNALIGAAACEKRASAGVHASSANVTCAERHGLLPTRALKTEPQGRAARASSGGLCVHKWGGVSARHHLRMMAARSPARTRAASFSCRAVRTPGAYSQQPHHYSTRRQGSARVQRTQSAAAPSQPRRAASPAAAPPCRSSPFACGSSCARRSMHA